MDVSFLKYAQAADLAAILNSISGSFISDAEGMKTVITHHEKTNSLIVSTSGDNLNSIRSIIAKLDIRRAQVLVEAIVVDLSENAEEGLVLRLSILVMMRIAFQWELQGFQGLVLTC